jgi:hypothetical protein
LDTIIRGKDARLELLYRIRMSKWTRYARHRLFVIHPQIFRQSKLINIEKNVIILLHNIFSVNSSYVFKSNSWDAFNKSSPIWVNDRHIFNSDVLFIC